MQSIMRRQEDVLITISPPLLSSVQMTPADIKNIREIAEREDVLELLAKSLAPSIYGHDHIKKALVLQLLVSHYYMVWLHLATAKTSRQSCASNC